MPALTRSTIGIACLALAFAGACTSEQADTGDEAADIEMDATETPAAEMDEAGSDAEELDATTESVAANVDEAVVGSWEWISFDGSMEEVIQVPDPSKYTLELRADGTASVLADCNRGAGNYTAANREMDMGPFAMTAMACPGESLGSRYAMMLDSAEGYLADPGMLNIRVEGGMMHFRPADGDM